MSGAASAYDVIVIGSGAGGMAAAVPLAQAGLKVVVLEQHDVPGGYCHSFTLEGYRFSPGVHYVGTLGPGGLLRRIYEGLGVSQDLAFAEMTPAGYDHAWIGDERFDFIKGRQEFIASLQKRFPADADGIAAYFDTVERLMGAPRTLRKVRGPVSAAKALPTVAALGKWGLKTGRRLIDAHVRDPVLRAVLAAQSGDHGLPPEQAPALLTAGITHHYLEGAFYPVGGGQSIPKAFVKALKRAGGDIRLKTPVDRILIEGGRAVGVRLADGEVLRASIVVSNADPEVTLGKLVGREHLPRRLVRKLDGTKYGVSALSLFFATDMDLRAAGIDSGNLWCYDHADLDAIYRDGLTDKALHEEPTSFFLSFPTLKDPSKMHHGHHTGEAFAFVDYEAFQKWADTGLGDRGADYEALKGELAHRMFAAIDRRIPGIKDRIVFWDLATPLTNEHYVNATRGSLYGTAKTLKQMGPGAYPVKSAIPGLYMVGASTFSFGVAGATMTGLAAAGKILGQAPRALLNQNGPELAIYPSEDPSAWPERLQARMKRGSVELPA